MTFIPPKITNETIADWFRKMVDKNVRTGSDYQNIVSMQEYRRTGSDYQNIVSMQEYRRTGSDYQNIVSMQEYREWLDELNREEAGE